MPFPEARRVIYKHNPLNGVICQLRFPPILKIDSEIPSIFQDRLRNEYPLYNEKKELHQQVISGIDVNLSQELFNQWNKATITKNHEFSTIDQNCSVNLTRTFLALSTKKYEKWEDFKGKLESVFKIFLEIYQPPFFTRIGLRYIDLIKRSILNLDGVKWDELIQPHILGIIATKVGEKVISFNNKYEIGLDDSEGFVNITTSFVVDKDTKEQCFLLDSDFFNSIKTSNDAVFNKLDYLHLRANRLLLWSIKEKLHLAMNPLNI